MMIIKFDLIFSENLFSDKLNQSTHINFEYCCYTKTIWKMIENIIGNSNTNIFQLKKWTIILLWDTGRSEVIKPNQHLYRNKTTYFKYFVFCRLIFFLLFGSIANFEFGIEKYFFLLDKVFFRCKIDVVPKALSATLISCSCPWYDLIYIKSCTFCVSSCLQYMCFYCPSRNRVTS